MSDSLGVSVATAATSLTAYLVPFAALMLISGTLAERFGRRRTVQVGYIFYTLASIGCALAPSFAVLMIARVVQGGSNAFTTPVLVAAVSDATPRERLGRALGLFGSMQATGQAMAPLVGGLAASVDWRLAFWGTALVSALLALLPPSGRHDGACRVNSGPMEGVGQSQARGGVHRRGAGVPDHDGRDDPRRAVRGRRIWPRSDRAWAGGCGIRARRVGIRQLARLAHGPLQHACGRSGDAGGAWGRGSPDRRRAHPRTDDHLHRRCRCGRHRNPDRGANPCRHFGSHQPVGCCLGDAGLPVRRRGHRTAAVGADLPIFECAALVLAGIPAVLAGLVLLVARRLRWAQG